MLKRAPIFLRVTEADGKCDALDQIDDTPRKNETLFTYRRIGNEVGHIHLNRSGGRGGFYTVAAYSLNPIQPTDGQMRDIEQWRLWCQAQGVVRTIRLRE